MFHSENIQLYWDNQYKLSVVQRGLLMRNPDNDIRTRPRDFIEQY